MGTNYVPESISAGLDTTATLNTNLTNIQTSLGRMLNINGDSLVGSNAMNIDLDMNSNRVINAEDAANASDLVTKRQVDALVATSLTNVDSVVVDYTPGGTGATETTVQAKLRTFVATSDFGTTNSDFANALTAAANKRLIVDNQVTITAAHTAATTVEIEVKKEGLIIDGTGGSLQINGGFICDPKNQAFSGFASGDIVFDTAGYSNAVERIGYPEWWGIDGTNDEVEINNCIAACRNTILTGQYVQDAAVIMPYDTAISRALIGLNRQATLLCNANNITQVHWSGTYGVMKGINIHGNGHTGTIGLKLATEDDVDDKTDVTWQATVQNQSHNIFDDLRFRAMDSGIVLACGPNVGGTDSNMYHNKFHKMEFFDCATRGILFRDMTSGSDPLVGSGANANYFERPTFLGTIATGIDIDAAGGGVFINPHFENITKAINVDNTMTNTGANPRNFFFYAHEENVTNPSTINNATTIMAFHDLDITGSIQSEIPIDFSSGQNGQLFLGGFRSLAEVEKMRLDVDGNLLLGGTSTATNATNTLHMSSGTQSASNVADTAQMLVKDIGGTGGQASYHVKNEQGTEGVVGVCVYKTTTGDVSPTHETMMQVNTSDDTFSIFANTAWKGIVAAPKSTTTALEDISNAINTSADKVDGYIILNTSTNKFVVANGSANGDLWKTFAGNTSHTPV